MEAGRSTPCPRPGQRPWLGELIRQPHGYPWRRRIRAAFANLRAETRGAVLADGFSGQVFRKIMVWDTLGMARILDCEAGHMRRTGT